MKLRYRVNIQWSETDGLFVVFLPDFKNVTQPCTHGKTYHEALKNAIEVMELLNDANAPEPKTLKYRPVSDAEWRKMCETIEKKPPRRKSGAGKPAA